MKRISILICICLLLLLLCGCRNTQPTVEETTPETTAPAVETEPNGKVTESPFDYESEIDFSEFETAGDTQPTEEGELVPTEAPTQAEPDSTKPTEPTVKPTEPEVNPTEPTVKPTEPAVTPTEPEETQKPTTATPSIGADGYNNQIVRP